MSSSTGVPPGNPKLLRTNQHLYVPAMHYLLTKETKVMQRADLARTTTKKIHTDIALTPIISTSVCITQVFSHLSQPTHAWKVAHKIMKVTPSTASSCNFIVILSGSALFGNMAIGMSHENNSFTSNVCLLCLKVRSTRTVAAPLLLEHATNTNTVTLSAWTWDQY